MLAQFERAHGRTPLMVTSCPLSAGVEAGFPERARREAAGRLKVEVHPFLPFRLYLMSWK